MIVTANTLRFDSLSLDSGATLAPVEVTYESYGELNAARSNAILVLHAFSGDAHAAGISPETGQPGWWDNMIGPGKAFDTNRYFVICSNVLGGCRGTTGPSSINLATGCPYGMSFPVITVGDMVRLQRCGTAPGASAATFYTNLTGQESQRLAASRNPRMRRIQVC